MSDELDASNLAIHGGGAGAIALAASWVTNFFNKRKEEAAEKARVEADKALAILLTQLSGKVDQLLAAQAKTDGLAERVGKLSGEIDQNKERITEATNFWREQVRELVERIQVLERAPRKIR